MSNRLRAGLVAAATGALVAAGLIWFVLPDNSANQPPVGEEMAAFEPSTPEPAPEISFSDASGNTLTLADFQGQVVVLNFWATWCAPCVREMPALDRLQAEFADAPVTVIALSVDREGAEAVAPFYADHGIEHLDVYLDQAFAVPPAFGVAGLPTTIVIDARGQTVGRLGGAAEWDSADAQALVRYYLDRG